MFVSDSLTYWVIVNIDFTDVTLVSEYAFGDDEDVEDDEDDEGIEDEEDE